MPKALRHQAEHTVKEILTTGKLQKGPGVVKDMWENTENENNQSYLEFLLLQ